jgi:hypothetical protein
VRDGGKFNAPVGAGHFRVDNLRSVVHFGSTVQRPIKRDTDVDLLLVLRTVPSGRGARMLMTSATEQLMTLRWL